MLIKLFIYVKSLDLTSLVFEKYISREKSIIYRLYHTRAIELGCVDYLIIMCIAKMGATDAIHCV